MPDPPSTRFTRADARDIFTAAATAKPDQQLAVFARRLAARVVAQRVYLYVVRCGDVHGRDLMSRTIDPRPVNNREMRRFDELGATPRVVGRELLLPIPDEDPDGLVVKRRGAVLSLRFTDSSNPMLASGRRHWAGLRTLGNLLQHLLADERDHRLTQRLRALQRRGAQPHRPTDLAYPPLYAARDLLGFSGYCAILLMDHASESMELFAHWPARDDRAAGDVPDLTLPFAASHAALLLSRGHRRTAWLAIRGQRNRRHFYHIVDITPTKGPGVRALAPDKQPALNALVKLLHTRSIVSGRSLVILPLIHGSGGLGFFVIGAREPFAFSPAEITTVWELGLECVAPLARAAALLSDFRLAEEVIARTSPVRPVSPRTESETLRATLALLCDSLRRLVQADSVALLPYDYKVGELQPDNVAFAGLRPDVRGNVPQPGGLVEQVLASDEPVDWQRHDGPHDLPPTAFVEKHELTRSHGSCLRDGVHNPIGVVFVNWRATHADRPIPLTDQRRIAEFCTVAQTYLAHHTARVREHNLHTRLYGVFAEVLSTIEAASGDIDHRAVRKHYAGQLLDVALDLVGGTAGIFAEPSSDDYSLRVVVSRAHTSDTDNTPIPYGDGITGNCGSTRTSCILPSSTDPATWPDGFRPRRVMIDALSELGFPVLEGGDHGLLVGVFDLENQKVINGFSDSDLPVMERIAQAGAVVFGLLRQIEQMQSIATLGTRIDLARRESDEAVLSIALEEAARVTGAYAAGARIADRTGTQLLPRTHHGVPGEWANLPIRTSEGVNGAAYSTAEAVVVHNTRDPSAFPPSVHNYIASRPETLSECAVPIIWRGNRIGVCNFEHRQEAAFAPYRHYLSTIAAQVAHALDEARHQARHRVEQGAELVSILSAFYMNVNHTIANRFRDIEHAVAELGADANTQLSRKARASAARALAISRNGTADAAALLRGATGRLEDVQVQNVATIIDQVVARIDAQTGAGDHISGIATIPQGLHVMVQPGMLVWILQEVVSNSLRYGGSDVTVSLAVAGDPRRGVVNITLDDDGPGLDQDKLTTLYDVSSAGSERGLGLIAASEYLAVMNGRIRSRASPLGGLRTVITLPWSREDGGVTAAPVP